MYAICAEIEPCYCSGETVERLPIPGWDCELSVHLCPGLHLQLALSCPFWAPGTEKKQTQYQSSSNSRSEAL
jgi:hypothetical protein